MNRNLCRLALILSFATVLGACSSNPKPEPVVETAEPVLSAATAAPIRQTDRGPALTVDDVLFDFEKATLRPAAASTIAQVSRYLQQHEGQWALIEGHTDNIGAADYNLDLSEARARTVYEALLTAGVPAHRLQHRGLGESYPVAANASAEGRQANRRVEIVFKSNLHQLSVR